MDCCVNRIPLRQMRQISPLCRLCRQRYERKKIIDLVIEEEIVSPATAYRIVKEGKARRILRRNKVAKTYALA